MVDIPANASTTANLTLGVGTSSTIDVALDHDWFRVTLVAGTTYSFVTSGTATGALTDTTLTLFNAAGAQLATNDDAGGGLYSRITFTATASGTYYVDVGAYQNLIGNYNLIAQQAAALPTYTNDQISNQLINGYWNFAGSSAHHWNVAPGGFLSVNITGLNAAGQFFARAALTAWTDATGINFFETNGVAQITFDDNATGAYENDVFSNGITTSATINIGTAWIAGDGQNLNSYSFQTYIHEIGHALGLGHAGNYNGSATYGVDNQYTNDSWQATVMSYFSQTDNTSMANSFAYIMTPMMADLIAVGAMYGATTTAHLGATIYGFGTNTGNAVYNAALNPGVSYTILDSGGVDTMNYSGFSQAQLINLYSETFSNIGGLVGNVGIARNTIIENAIGGSGNDTIFGNQVGNFLNGAAGYDYIDGGAGNDTVDYSGATGASYIELYLNRAYNDGYGFYDSLFNVESVYGGSFGDTIVADGFDNVLVGNGGVDVIFAGWGNDYIVGGVGGDYVNGSLGFDQFAFSASDFAAGVWDGIADFSQVAGNFDYLRFIGLTAGNLVMQNYNGAVIISTAALNYAGGIVVYNATIADLADQLIYA